MKGGEAATQWQAPASFGWLFHYAWDKDALDRTLRGSEKSWILTTLLPPKTWVYIIILEKEILTVSALLIRSKPTNNSPPSGWTELGTSKPVSFSGAEGPSERQVPPIAPQTTRKAVNLGQHSNAKSFLSCFAFWHQVKVSSADWVRIFRCLLCAGHHVRRVWYL